MKRFAVVTFRGYQLVDNYYSAKVWAKQMIDEIKEDGFDDTYWWAEIKDRNRGITRIVTLLGNHYWNLTKWMHI